MTGVCYDLNDTVGKLDKWNLCFVIYMFLSNNPSSGDMNSSNLPCLPKFIDNRFKALILLITDFLGQTLKFTDFRGTPLRPSFVFNLFTPSRMLLGKYGIKDNYFFEVNTKYNRARVKISDFKMLNGASALRGIGPL